ncbi:MAG: hypothetical protein AB1499_17695 [Nitrospirota bacterium]
MKATDCKLIRKANNVYFWITIVVLPLISLVLVWTCFDLGYAFAERKYSLMSGDMARQFVEKLVKNHQLPSPSLANPYSYWKLSTLPSPGIKFKENEYMIIEPSKKEFRFNLYLPKGIKISDNDYIVFASAEPISFQIIPIENLSEFLPGIEKIYMGTYFILNGILFSTLDFEVVNKQIYTRSGNKWTKTKRVIKQGGYAWYLGPAGIYLGYQEDKLIAFKEPKKLLPFSPSGPVGTAYLVDLSISPEESGGILVKIAGEVIQLKLNYRKQD